MRTGPGRGVGRARGPNGHERLSVSCRCVRGVCAGNSRTARASVTKRASGPKMSVRYRVGITSVLRRCLSPPACLECQSLTRRTPGALPLSSEAAKGCFGGRLAQLVERFVYTEDVGSSSLSSPTIPDRFAQQIKRSDGRLKRCLQQTHSRFRTRVRIRQKCEGSLRWRGSGLRHSCGRGRCVQLGCLAPIVDRVPTGSSGAVRCRGL